MSCRIQNEQPEGVSPEGGPVMQSVSDSVESQTTWKYSHLGLGGRIISN